MWHERKGKGQYKNIHRRRIKRRNFTVPFCDQGKNKNDMFFFFKKKEGEYWKKCRFYPTSGPWFDNKI